MGTPKSPEGDLTPKSPEGDLTPKSPEGDLTPKSPKGDLTPKSPKGDLTPKSPKGDLLRYAGITCLRSESSPPLGGWGVPLNPLKGTYSASRVLLVCEVKVFPL
jgi:hypothetical protein